MFTSLISSSDDSSITERNVFRYLPDPTILLDNLSNSKINTYAALIENNEKQAIVVADSDLTANYLWVRCKIFMASKF